MFPLVSSGSVTFLMGTVLNDSKAILKLYSEVTFYNI